MPRSTEPAGLFPRLPILLIQGTSISIPPRSNSIDTFGRACCVTATYAILMVSPIPGTPMSHETSRKLQLTEAFLLKIPSVLRTTKITYVMRLVRRSCVLRSCHLYIARGMEVRANRLVIEIVLCKSAFLRGRRRPRHLIVTSEMAGKHGRAVLATYVRANHLSSVGALRSTK